jgi:hypothetical protein
MWWMACWFFVPLIFIWVLILRDFNTTVASLFSVSRERLCYLSWSKNVDMDVSSKKKEWIQK